MKPLIGITTNYVKDNQIGLVAHIGGEGQYWQALADDYTQAIVVAEGIPVIIPVLSNEKEQRNI